MAVGVPAVNRIGKGAVLGWPEFVPSCPVGASNTAFENDGQCVPSNIEVWSVDNGVPQEWTLDCGRQGRSAERGEVCVVGGGARTKVCVSDSHHRAAFLHIKQE